MDDDPNNSDYDDEPVDLPVSGKYDLLMKDQIYKERDKKIDEFIENSCISREEGELVLIHYNWNYDLLMNDWFEKTDLIKIESGIKQSKASLRKVYEYFKKNKVNNKYCLICYDEMGPKDYYMLGCEHKVCKDCYKEYLAEKLKDQLTVLSTPCPMNGCNYIVTRRIFEQCFKRDPELMNIYNKCLVRNFTESNSDIKLCPNPKCDICILVPGHGMVEVKCQCGNVFCFKCLKESHRPCDCEMIECWEKKNKSDGENTKWLIVNTKQCPNCHKYIEKNQGCNHMTCRKEAGGCGYEFCWICLGEWKPHGSSWYQCTRYNPSATEKEKEKIRENAKFELERYANFFDSYSQQVKAQKYADNMFGRIKQFKECLEKDKNQPHCELEFLDEALKTVIDCHRVLKNTYIFGYYMKTTNIKAKFFEHNQGILSNQADLLHELLELDELPRILKIDELEPFNKELMAYKSNIITLIASTAKFREALLNEIENDTSLIDLNALKK